MIISTAHTTRRTERTCVTNVHGQKKTVNPKGRNKLKTTKTNRKKNKDNIKQNNSLLFPVRAKVNAVALNF